MFHIFIFLFAISSSYFLTWLFRRYALAQSLMDIPNERSSHTIPTPRGGGVAIVITFFIGLLILRLINLQSWKVTLMLLGSGLCVAIIGFLDDRKHIAARWRLLGHFLGASWALFWLNGLPPLTILELNIELSWLGYVVAAIYLVWLLNLYNFMDGIDGLASIEAISVCIGGIVIYLYLGKIDLALPLILLAGAVSGFLIWNYPPAKIFMGDAGSGFLGITLAILSLQAAWASSQLFWSWLILLGVFIVDATITLLRRLIRRDKVYEAHRSHAYQHAAQTYESHKPISIIVGLINLLWLMPLALMVAISTIDGLIATLIAYTPLFILAFKFKAGTKH